MEIDKEIQEPEDDWAFEDEESEENGNNSVKIR